ncbi:MAG: NAD(P)H-hydrate epimerase, partial [Clostridia bacterium]|nr:NAD(P)H-hydrate epimerase [Clostridia bacterium]
MRVYNKAQITEIESNCEKNGVITLELMEAVGKAAFNETCRVFGDNIKSVAVVCGSGNNGGDGLVAARYFDEKGAKTTVILAFGEVKTDNSKSVFDKIGDVDVINYAADKALAHDALNNADVIIDAVYGIGFHGEIPSDITELTSLMAENYNKTVAFDLPSGAECDNGQISANCVKAAYTLAFIACKPCHFLYPSAECCGKVIEVSLDIP